MDSEEIKERLDIIERENRKIRQENQQLKKIISKSVNTGSQSSDQSRENVSRREFLKKLGAGVIGLGALSMAPAASWTRISNQGITQDGEQLYLGLGGSNSMTGDLDMGGYKITNLAEPTSDNDAVQKKWIDDNLASKSHDHSSDTLNPATIETDGVTIEGLVDDAQNDEYLTKIGGANTLYWGNVDPSTVESPDQGDIWADNSEVYT